MTYDHFSDHEQIDLYVDNLLTGEDLAHFESRLAADPALRAEVDLQKRINQSFQRVYEPTPPAPLDLRPVNRRFPWRLAAGIAAALLVVVSISLYMRGPSAEERRAALQYIDPVTMYRTLEAAGWPVSFTCSTDEEFALAISKRFGPRLHVPVAGSKIELVGWTYNTGKSPLGRDTLFLISKVDDKPVLVFMDFARADRDFVIPQEEKLSLFKRQFGDMVLYELTPNCSSEIIYAMKELPAPGSLPAQERVPALIADAARQLLVSRAFEPTVAESDRESLEMLLSEKLSHSIRLPDDKNIKYLGIHTHLGETPLGIVLLATVRDERFLVLFDISTAHTSHERQQRDIGTAPVIREQSRIQDGILLVQWGPVNSPGLLDSIRVE